MLVSTDTLKTNKIKTNTTNISAAMKSSQISKLPTPRWLLTAFLALLLSGLAAHAAPFVQPTTISGTTASGLQWADVANGTALPIRTTATSVFNGAPGAVAYFNTQTGQLQVDPKGLSLNAVIITYTTGTVNVSGTTAGPFQYTTGTGTSAWSPTTGTARTFPAIQVLTGLPPTTFAARVGTTIGAPLSPSLATSGDVGNIASDNGWWNKPWSFPLDLVKSDSVSSIVISNFKTIGQNTHPNANILGYGNGFATFQYGINGVSGTQVGPVIPYTTAPASSLATLATTPTSSSIRTTTATLGGEVTADGGAAITVRGVVYSLTATDSDPQVGASGVTNLPAIGTTGVFSVNATALTPGAAYSFKAYATNSVGTSYSTAGTFTALRPVAGWRLSNFGAVANSGNGANSASPAGDSIPNLVKYALCLNPTQQGGLPQAEIGNNRLKLTFQRDPARSDITITVEGTSDLVNGPWAPVATSTSGGAFSGNGSVSETPLEGGLQRVEVSDSVDTLTAPRRRFLRIRTTLPAE